jgi:cobalt transporter subunit CbtB
MSTRAFPTTQDLSFTRNKTIVGTFTLLLGLGALFIVGFSPLSVAHNAAHDTRHTAAFPCH